MKTPSKSIRIRCPLCSSAIRIPVDYSGTRGRCPSCGGSLDVRSLISEKSRNSDTSAIHAHSRRFTLFGLTKKHSAALKQYGIDLQKIYTLMRQRMLKRKEYEEQKAILRRQVFTPIIDDAVKLSDAPFSPEDQIELWKMVFELLPYSYPEKDSDTVFNLYPRYELAGLTGLVYILGGYPNADVKREILIRAVNGDRNSPQMKSLFAQVRNSPYNESLIKRVQEFLENTRNISKSSTNLSERALKQIEEDFNYGVSWTAFHVIK
jgi:hypothetical protein